MSDIKRLECVNYTYAIIRTDENGKEAIVYLSPDYSEAEKHFDNFYQNYDWKKDKFKLVEIWGNYKCPILEFNINDMTILNK